MMKLLGVTLTAFVLLRTVTCDEIPFISNITHDQVKNIGEAVDLKCSVQSGNVSNSVQWIQLYMGSSGSILDRYGSSQISTDTTLHIEDSRFTIQYDPSSFTYTLQIKDVQEEDSGVYVCRILTHNHFAVLDKAKVELQVIPSPNISYDTTETTVTVQDSETTYSPVTSSENIN